MVRTFACQDLKYENLGMELPMMNRQPLALLIIIYSPAMVDLSLLKALLPEPTAVITSCSSTVFRIVVCGEQILKIRSSPGALLNVALLLLMERSQPHV